MPGWLFFKRDIGISCGVLYNAVSKGVKK